MTSNGLPSERTVSKALENHIRDRLFSRFRRSKFNPKNLGRAFGYLAKADSEDL